MLNCIDVWTENQARAPTATTMKVIRIHQGISTPKSFAEHR